MYAQFNCQYKHIYVTFEVRARARFALTHKFKHTGVGYPRPKIIERMITANLTIRVFTSLSSGFLLLLAGVDQQWKSVVWPWLPFSVLFISTVSINLSFSNYSSQRLREIVRSVEKAGWVIPSSLGWRGVGGGGVHYRWLKHDTILLTNEFNKEYKQGIHSEYFIFLFIWIMCDDIGGGGGYISWIWFLGGSWPP